MRGNNKELTELQIAEALKTCASEPIHIPGSIQPHGVLLMVQPGGYQIMGCSANAQTVFGISVDKLRTKSLANFLSVEDLGHLDALLAKQAIHTERTLQVEILEECYDLSIHLSNNLLIVEIEKAQEKTSKSDDVYYDDLRIFSKELREANSTTDLYNIVVRHVHALTDFDRVKLYKFDKDWNGHVIAESRKKGIHSYKGLHFPASDIPEQARILYSKNYIRIICDIEYTPQPVIRFDDSTEPVDLSFSVLRSVSPVHIQYLRNMGVQASMSISIMQDGKLWGLVACHHMSPIYLSQRIRIISELMGHVFSSLLSSYSQVETREDEAGRKVLLERLAVSFDKNDLNKNLVDNNADELIEALSANGLATRINGKVSCYGNCPAGRSLTTLFTYLAKSQNTTVFLTDNIEENLNLPDTEITGGILALPLDNRGEDFIVWFRHAEVADVNWAGKPEKHITETIGGYRLTPRGSFNLWRETVKNRSTPWNKVDITTAQSIVRLILEYDKNVAKLQNKYKSEFLAEMSHELRTPMNAIIGISEILSKNSSMDEATKKLVNTLHNNSEHLLELINDLLDLSKVESNQVTIEHVPFNLADTVETTIQRLNPKAVEKGLLLNSSLPSRHHLHYFGDTVKIKQILTNIISNAIKFTHTGFVNILVKIEPSAIDNSDNVIFEISDTGIGMTDEQINKIFKKYGQASNDTHRVYGGTGLGLAISKQLIELFGGSIAVASNPGMGSRFTVSLPLSKNEAGGIDGDVDLPVLSKSYQVKESSAKPEKKKTKVLLVEDYDGNIIVATHCLEQLGYEVISALNGQEALDYLKKEEVGLILMDVKMPVMDGIEATLIIREMQRNGEIKPCNIVGMSAHAFIGDKDKCIKAGMDKYLSKPFSYDDLKSVVDSFVQN